MCTGWGVGLPVGPFQEDPQTGSANKQAKMRVFEKKLHFCFFLFYVGVIETEKRKKWKRQKKTIKIVFLRWSSKNVKTQKNGFFCKNCLTLFVSGREKKRAFSCTLSVLAKKFFGPKQCKPGNTIKIVVSAQIAQNQNDTFFWTKVFLKWVKNGFY